jgi:hypothetical protein
MTGELLVDGTVSSTGLGGRQAEPVPNVRERE